jgi:hypothetical protein
MPISNAEKQRRFRLKQRLLDRTNEAIRECLEAHSQAETQSVVSAADVKLLLEKAAQLPRKWTEYDLSRAIKRVEREHKRVSDLIGVPRVEPKVPTEVRTLADHLMSAIKLSNYSNDDAAEALMAVACEVGEALLKTGGSREDENGAVAFCIEGMLRSRSRGSACS